MELLAILTNLRIHHSAIELNPAHGRQVGTNLLQQIWVELHKSQIPAIERRLSENNLKALTAGDSKRFAAQVFSEAKCVPAVC
jgi:hypothetical protein